MVGANTGQPPSGPSLRSCSDKFTENARSNANTSSTDERTHNDDGALAGLNPVQVGRACSNTNDGGPRARRETCALAQARRRRVVCCALLLTDYTQKNRFSVYSVGTKLCRRRDHCKIRYAKLLYESSLPLMRSLASPAAAQQFFIEPENDSFWKFDMQ